MKSLVIMLVLLCSAECYAQDGLVSPYVRYSERYGGSTARYSTNPPRLYSSGGTYLGELSENRYRPDSISNRYGIYGSRYSPTSVNNPYSPFGQYRTQSVYVYPYPRVR